jgi:hypothetical protein
VSGLSPEELVERVRRSGVRTNPEQMTHLLDEEPVVLRERLDRRRLLQQPLFVVGQWATPLRGGPFGEGIGLDLPCKAPTSVR